MSSTPDATALSALVVRVARGDRAACGPLFDALWPQVLRFCQRMLRAEANADAEDAAQEAMMKVFARAVEYDTSRAVLPWALAISAWECRTLLQKHRRRRQEPTTDATLAKHPAKFAQDAAAPNHIADKELAAQIDAALDQLSAQDRASVVQAFWEDAAPHTLDEVEPGSAAARKRKQRALARLRIIWRKLYG